MRWGEISDDLSLWTLPAERVKNKSKHEVPLPPPAREILANNREVLTKIANALLEREVLDASEIKLLMDGKELPSRPSSHDDGNAVQHVLKPAPGSQPGMVPGERPSPA